MEAQSAKSADVRAPSVWRWLATMVLAGIAGLIASGSLTDWRTWAVIVLVLAAAKVGE